MIMKKKHVRSYTPDPNRLRSLIRKESEFKCSEQQLREANRIFRTELKKLRVPLLKTSVIPSQEPNDTTKKNTWRITHRSQSQGSNITEQSHRSRSPKKGIESENVALPAHIIDCETGKVHFLVCEPQRQRFEAFLSSRTITSWLISRNVSEIDERTKKLAQQQWARQHELVESHRQIRTEAKASLGKKVRKDQMSLMLRTVELKNQMKLVQEQLQTIS